MRKIQKALLGVLIGGVLLSGIGTGIAFVEYSTLSYGGQKVIGEENLVTKSLICDLKDSHTKVIILENFNHRIAPIHEIIEDSSISENKIQYDITYNEKAIRPFLWTDESRDSASEKIDTIRIGLSTEYFGDEFGEFMKNKDLILYELKQRKISSYTTNYVTDVVIRVHPDTVKLIQSQH